MNTAKPRNDLFDIWTVYNPSPTPYEVYYNSELHKIIQPGKAVRIVKMIADINVEHLIDRMCKLQGVSKNDMVARAAWRGKIVITETTNAMPAIPTEIDMAKQFQQTLDTKPITEQLPKDPILPVRPDWKFDPITGEPIKPKATGITPDQIQTANVEIQTEVVSPNMPEVDMADVPTHSDPETNNILSNLRSGGEARVLKEQVINEDEVPQVPTKKTEKPTREAMMAYAATIMAINDPKTKATLDAMTDDQLRKELRYDDVVE